jgi:hypothetical protein
MLTRKLGKYSGAGGIEINLKLVVLGLSCPARNLMSGQVRSSNFIFYEVILVFEEDDGGFKTSLKFRLIGKDLKKQELK